MEDALMNEPWMPFLTSMRNEMFKNNLKKQYHDVRIVEAMNMDYDVERFVISFATHLKDLQLEAVRQNTPLFGESMEGLKDRKAAFESFESMPFSFIDHGITSMEARGIDLAVKISSLWPLHIADYTLTDTILRMRDDSVFFRFKAFRESIEGDTREMYSEGSTSDGVGSALGSNPVDATTSTSAATPTKSTHQTGSEDGCCIIL